jgi:ADP-heptose:LPS heptosyltransferase
VKILVIRFSSIGDIILTTPVLRCLKTQRPDCDIHFVTKAVYRDLLAANPHVTKLHLLEDRLEPLVRQLQAEQFDVVVDLHNSTRSRLVRRRLRGRKLVVRKRNLRKWFMVRFKRTRKPLRHFAERCLDAVAPLGIRNDAGGLEHFVPVEDHVDINRLPETHRLGYVVVGIGARHATKRMPVQKLIAVCEALAQPLILLGDDGDTAVGDQVAAACGSRVYNACGQFSINQSASVISQSRAVISHDSAVMHLAAALRKPVVSVWGNTVPEFGMYPYFGQPGMDHDLSVMAQVTGLRCRPCSKLGHSKCPRGHFRCMHDISETRIAAAVERFCA